ncbi:hypothetical protein BT67DRAFT_373679 [Trichocladium antarcticum]|uniref:Ankyrin repeat protein n=1 Tax=Trichocladium antarcticum TaxID=1450529 RepID=A0AAN6UPJ4_9PEZI|nr:hypothetical protein BT67DRAFT_373679 [Trichocladium antarcticum]
MSGDHDASAAGPQTDETTGASATRPAHEPTIADVLVIKTMLNRSLRLPPEIIDTVVDLAEYWPHSSTEVLFNDGSVVARGNNIHTQGTGQENGFMIRTPPLGLRTWRRSLRKPNQPVDTTPPKPQPPGEEFSTDDFQNLTAAPPPMLAHPCRRIVFTIKSHDQGWGGDFANQGTYNGSWTWFEAGLERWCTRSPTGTDVVEQQAPQAQQPSLTLDDICTVLPPVEWDPETEEHDFKHPLCAADNLKVQSNVTAEREWKTHRVVWSYTDDIDPERDVEAAVKLEEQGRGKATGDGKFVRDLKLGDVVTLWAMARFGGWVNKVESAKIDVYYAV